MNLKEAITEIKGRTKPYAQVGMPQSTFSNTLRNIEVGLVKDSTIEKFMAKFGYKKVTQEATWEK